MNNLLREMNKNFNYQLYELLSTKNANTQILTKAAYLNLIEKVKCSKKKQKSKLPEDYQRLRRYDVISIGDQERLIVPVKEGNHLIKHIVHTEEIFQIIHDTHISMNHSGRNVMAKELNDNYKNITREMIVIYKNLCEICQNKKITAKKDLGNVINSKCNVSFHLKK